MHGLYLRPRISHHHLVAVLQYAIYYLQEPPETPAVLQTYVMPQEGEQYAVMGPQSPYAYR